MKEAEGEPLTQYVLLPENNYNTSIYRQGSIYNFLRYNMSQAN